MNKERPSHIERNIKSDIFELLNDKKFEIVDSAYPAERIAGLIDAYCHARSATVKACKQFVTMWIDSQNLEIEY
jgi:hypothetical protein